MIITSSTIQLQRQFDHYFGLFTSLYSYDVKEKQKKMPAVECATVGAQFKAADLQYLVYANNVNSLQVSLK